MFKRISKNIVILALVMIALIAASFFAVRTVANAEAEVDRDAIYQQLTPRRSEYGAAGDLVIDGTSVYKNYEYGCVTATLSADNTIVNTRDYGGVNYSAASGKLEFLKSGDDYKLKSMISDRNADGNVMPTWQVLKDKFNSDVSYNKDRVLEKIYDKYAALCEEGYNCGIPTGTLSVWDNSVIKLDFYDGDSEYGFGETDGRTHVTTIAYSFIMDEAFAIRGKIFDFYKDAKAGSLSEPITEPFPYKESGVDGMAQAFALGYIFYPNGSNKLTVRSGVQWDGKKFAPLQLTEEELTLTEIDDDSLKDSPYYYNYTIDQVKKLFYNKYKELIASGFNPGIPDHEGIYYWDTELLKQAYVGSDGTGNAWGRTNMMLILNPYDGNVYMVYGEILNLVDKASHGLGNARSLGYPTCDPTEATVRGIKYTYQNFYRPYYTDLSESTIYTINASSQLTRHIVGGYFEDVVAGNKKVSANNPKYYYVVEPWLISLICIIPVLLAGAGVAVYFFVFKKKKNAAVQAVAAVEGGEPVQPVETAGTAEPAETTETEGNNE